MSYVRPHPRPWHRNSTFGPGRRVKLDRNQRARFRYLVNVHHGGGRLTRAERDVGLALLQRHGADGQCDPAHTTLATDADCSDRTVRRATGAMRDLGLVRWQTRLVRAGWRAEQTSNAYELVPALAVSVVPPVRPVRCGGQNVRETRKEDFSVLQPSAAEVAEARRAIAEIRVAREERLLNKTRGR